MVLNKKAQMINLGIMMWVFAFVVAIALAPTIKDMTADARDASNLDCDAEGLSTGVYATCIIVDWYLPYFIGVII